MQSHEKQVEYLNKNTYSTLNEIGEQTRYIWLVFHGIGYLSRYFLRYFQGLNKSENYIIAPQAPSKYYLNGAYKHVGASWLTKEQTELEKENLYNYLEALISNESIPAQCRFVVMGFSQGVSIAVRWLARKKLPCEHLILYAGGVPKEVEAVNFDYPGTPEKVTYIIGESDIFLTPERMSKEKEKLKQCFKDKLRFITFPGGHEMRKELITEFQI